MDTLRKEIIYRLPKITSSLVLALIFWVAHHIVLATSNTLKIEHIFVLQIGFVIAAGIFLVRTLINILPILDKFTESFFRSLRITEGFSRQRILKDTVYIISILLATAAICPFFNNMTTIEPMLQQITTYFAMGLILLFLYDIGRTFYRISEKKANSITKWFSRSKKGEEY
jgi:cation transport ATPase